MAKRPEYTPPFDPDTMRRLRENPNQFPLQLRKVNYGLDQDVIDQTKDNNREFFIEEILSFFTTERIAALRGVDVVELSRFICPDESYFASFSEAVVRLSAQGVLRHNEDLLITYGNEEDSDDE